MLFDFLIASILVVAIAGSSTAAKSDCIGSVPLSTSSAADLAAAAAFCLAYSPCTLGMSAAKDDAQKLTPKAVETINAEIKETMFLGILVCIEKLQSEKIEGDELELPNTTVEQIRTKLIIR